MIQPYRQIATLVRDRILSGELAPGDLLPSENELARQSGVVRATATRALDLLRSEGLIVTSQGSRARVRRPPELLHIATGANFRNRQRSAASNEVAEAEAQGHKSVNRLIEVGDVRAPFDVAERLGVSPGAVVTMRHQVTYIGDHAMKILRSYFRREFAAGTPLVQKRLIRGGVSQLLEAKDGPFQRTIAQMVEDVELRGPLPAEAEVLEIPRGVPVAYILRTTYDTSGDALEVLAAVLPGDRFRLRYNIPIPPA